MSMRINNMILELYVTEYIVYRSLIDEIHGYKTKEKFLLSITFLILKIKYGSN